MRFRRVAIGAGLALAGVLHAEVDKSSTAASVWRLIHFWSKMLNE